MNMFNPFLIHKETFSMMSKNGKDVTTYLYTYDGDTSISHMSNIRLPIKDVEEFLYKKFLIKQEVLMRRGIL